MQISVIYAIYTLHLYIYIYTHIQTYMFMYINVYAYDIYIYQRLNRVQSSVFRETDFVSLLLPHLIPERT